MQLLHKKASVIWGLTVALSFGAPSPTANAQVDSSAAEAKTVLTQDREIDWKTQRIDGVIDLNGHRLVKDTGGGNVCEVNAQLIGEGHFIWHGGGTGEWQRAVSIIQGAEPNLFHGQLSLTQGTLALSKPSNVPAFSGGVLLLGGGKHAASLHWRANHQLNESVHLQTVGPHICELWLNGCQEKLGTITLGTDTTIFCLASECSLTFAASASQTWNPQAELIVHQWDEQKCRLQFGSSPSGVTPEQLSQIGFSHPEHYSESLYQARITEDGHIVPGDAVVAKDPPFPIDRDSREQRQLVYKSAGLAELRNAPAITEHRISFFGDSLTWQNGFIQALQQSIDQNPQASQTIRLINRGINGGGVLAVRDGTDTGAYVSPQEQNGKQASFAEVLQTDRSTIAIVMIGINDVWWRKTSPETYATALRDIATAAKQQGTHLVLVTLTGIGEKPDGTNPHDAACDQFAELVREVAREQALPVVDLRRVFRAYLQNYNARLRLDGRVVPRSEFLLTYDGVHLTALGNELVANHLAAAIAARLKQ